MRTTIFAAFAACLTVATLTAAPASAGGSCATSTDYENVLNGDTVARVSQILNQPGAVLGWGPYLASKRYAACDGTHKIYVNFKRTDKSQPRRAYFKLWGY